MGIDRREKSNVKKENVKEEGKGKVESDEACKMRTLCAFRERGGNLEKMR